MSKGATLHINVLYIRFSIIKKSHFSSETYINEVRLTIKQSTCNWLVFMFIFMYKDGFNMLRLRFLSSNLLSLCILMHNMIMNSQHITYIFCCDFIHDKKFKSQGSHTSS